jgi:hypothetical protein
MQIFTVSAPLLNTIIQVLAPNLGHSDYRTVSSPYLVLPVYLELIRAVWADYFDEMRSSFNLVQNQLFALTKLNIYKTNCLNLSNRTSMASVLQKKGT